jgi:AhpD family alkylhydroperoxidase
MPRIALAGDAPANLERLLGNSPAALEGYRALRSALQGGFLDPRLRHALALAVSEANGCAYGLSRAVAEARTAGFDEDHIVDARQACSPDERTRAALLFGEGLVHAHGGVSDTEIARVRACGYSDGEIVEIIANVALNVMENYFALAARIRPDADPVTPFASRD